MEKSSLIIITISSFIFILGFRNLIKRYFIIKKGIKTTAVLAGLKQTKPSGGTDGSDQISYWPLIEFYNNGKLIEQTLSQSMPHYVHRKKILITYLKSNDKYKIINHETNAFYYISCVLTFISGCCIIYIIMNK
jgi:hypothetical protein